ncbi:MAG: 30S ribosomal protein S3 [Candidatus Zixiibacteriota bacterium]|nr:MAG: 30S ribosomal protein S3 [candidate division Zixibacteria bacterium]
MGQKTHPYGLRLGVIKSWKSKWFASNNYADLLQEDLLIRRYTNRRLEHAGIAEVEILRAPKRVTIDILTARPGIVIGRKGAEVDKLKEELQLLTGKEILLNIIEIKKPEFSATLVAQSIAKQLEGRVNYRRAMKKALAAGMKSGAEGMKIVCSGRLAGAEIARSEKYHDGRVPLHTLRADIDYATATAHTTYGTIGVKVWICKGEIIGDQEDRSETAEKSALGLKEQPADTRRRRARRRKQVEDKQGPDLKFKPSAKELDKSQRRPRAKTGKPESGSRRPSGDSRRSAKDRKKSYKAPSDKPVGKSKDSGKSRNQGSGGGKE